MALSGIHRQVSWAGALELAGGGDAPGRKGPALLQAAVGPWPRSPPSLRPGVASASSCPFLSPSHLLGRACKVSFLRPNVSVTGALGRAGKCGPPPWFRMRFGGSEARASPRAGKQCGWNDWRW